MLQTPGNPWGYGVNYVDLESVGYVKAAAEITDDNSALMSNAGRREYALEGAIVGILGCCLRLSASSA